jgi:hypothetical protein
MSKTNIEKEHDPALPPESEAVDSNLEKIREILVGAEKRDSDRRFLQIEARLAKDVGSVREEIKKTIGTLEEYLRRELESLRRTDDEASRQTKELREKVFDLSKSVSAEMLRQMEELTSLLEGAARDLEGRKMERAALGGLLQEMGMRLSQESPILEKRSSLKKAG